ncbi:MAG: hypothetical protein IPK74_23765 [Deltaproteobacteria bacterium]|nr:hypothetical protein [Deltaproteobacteria bacterium]
MSPAFRCSLDPARRLALPALLLAACFSEQFRGDDGVATGGVDSGTTSGACTPGAETCPCLDGGVCDAGLICASQLCVDLGGTSRPMAGTDDGAEGGGTAKTTGDTGLDTSAGEVGSDTGTIDTPGSCIGQCGNPVPDPAGMCYCDPICANMGDCCGDYMLACPGACSSNDDCADTEVCSASTHECLALGEATYDLVVDQWVDHTPICWDGAINCFADPYYQVLYGGDIVFTSETVANTTNASWTVPWSSKISDATVLTLAFWDEDSLGDETIVTECFLDEGEICGPVPAAVLRDGGFLWDPGDGTYTVSVRITAQ